MRPLRVALALVLAAGTAGGYAGGNSNCRRGQGFCSQWTNHTVNGESRTPSVITHTQLSTVGRTLCLNLRRTARAQSSPRGTAALARGYANSGTRPSAPPARSSGRTSTSACKRPLSAAVLIRVPKPSVWKRSHPPTAPALHACVPNQGHHGCLQPRSATGLATAHGVRRAVSVG
jgi:hypothetical protein